MLGQMMEPLFIKSKIQNPCLSGRQAKSKTKKPWVLSGCKNRKPNVIRSLLLKEGALEKLNEELQKKYNNIRAREIRYETFNLKGADIALVAYGTVARIAKSVCTKVTKYKVGLIRPITLWPFPCRTIEDIADKVKAILVVEMSAGQMVEDVKLAVDGKVKVAFFGRTGGGIPTEEEIINKIRLLMQ
jgi:2-oxoglutarate ferredoxin oxidoreductase subunit alpha